MPTPRDSRNEGNIQSYDSATLKEPQPRIKETSPLVRKVRLVRAKPQQGFGSHSPSTVFVSVDDYFALAINGNDYQTRIRQQAADFYPGLRDFLRRLNEDFDGTMARLGRESGSCQFCNRPLRDERSTKAGYGPTCAERWGLAWGEAA